MKVDYTKLIPAEIPDEAAFHIVKFIHGLSLALESIYFDRMLTQSTSCEQEVACKWGQSDDEENPF